MSSEKSSFRSWCTCWCYKMPPGLSEMLTSAWAWRGEGDWSILGCFLHWVVVGFCDRHLSRGKC